MPTFSGRLGDAEVRNLVAHLRSFMPGPARPVQTHCRVGKVTPSCTTSR